MPKRILGAMLFAATVSSLAQGQTADDLRQSLQKQILHKRLFLRSMSADAETDYRWNGTAIVLTPPKVHTVAVFLADQVVLHPDKIIIEGSRNTLVRPAGGGFGVTGDSPAVLSIALNGTPAEQVLPHVFDEMFLTDMAEAMTLIPSAYARALPFQQTKDAPKKSSSYASETSNECPGGLFKPAKVVDLKSAYNPFITNHVPVETNLLFTVDTSGHPVDVWVAVPFGKGFDEAAAAALSNSLFKPATCSGVTIKSQLRLDSHTENR